MTNKFKIGDLVETVSYPRYGIILEYIPKDQEKYLPDCHALVAFLDGLTYWKLCNDLKLISSG